MPYSDPLGFIASGLFDGLALAFDTESSGTFSAGAWYTGLLFKQSAYITISDEDLASYNEGFSYDKFAETYFASRRLLFALGWDHPGLGELVRLGLSLLGQVDLNGREAYYHSQYLAARASVPVNNLVFDLGGSLGMGQAGGDLLFSMVGELGLSVFLPPQFQSRLKFSGIIASGQSESGSISPFIPITTEAQGNVLEAKVSGLSIFCLDYLARLHRTFSIGLSSTYFVLNDLGTYQGFPGGKDGHFLGNEFYGQLIWSPVSDLRFNLGGGAFLPSLGDADQEAGARWKVELNVQLAIF
jgi:hypothetical protein